VAARKAAKAGKKQGQVKAKAPSADLARLEDVLELMGRHDIAELEWEKSGERFHLKKPVAFAAPVYSQAPPFHSAPQLPPQAHSPGGAQAPSPGAVSGGASAPAPASNHKQVVSPFVGTFYRQASPTTDPYVKEGQSIKRGDTLCIIEAMKLMNEIEAEFPGKVITILVENGQPVEFGEPLFLVEV
jgi:acetyl-CoA carboxylase biotin carboxyl carrier protein